MTQSLQRRLQDDTRNPVRHAAYIEGLQRLTGFKTLPETATIEEIEFFAMYDGPEGAGA